MSKTGFYAHKTDDGRLQTIAEHAAGTAERAGRAAGAFGFGDAARAAGMFHDVGKYAPAFQARLCGSREAYEHSSAGMSLFFERSRKCRSYADMLLAYAIAGHHAGLPDKGSGSDTEDSDTFTAKIKRRAALGCDFGSYSAELGELPAVRELPAAFLPKQYDWYSYQFLGRMLFSSLVDADFLDTEAFMSGGTAARDGGEPFDTLRDRFERYMDRFSGKSGKLNENRAKILADCRCAAASEKGIFRLTVPTGGGKTLSSMAFALDHLRAHGMKRIIYVIPYVSIIRQTVGIFENIFGERNVLGHYGTADFGGGRETGERSPAELAAENWDKPIIVTTNVQFFESLHAAKPSHCRKLHSVADSVIIFDEAQMLPVGLLRPCLRAISELVKNYGCTAVLCTATQPALERLLADNGITAREICPDTARMYPDFARVRYEMLGKCSDDAVCERLRAAGSALCVLNSRAGVRSYYNALAGDGVFHLSTYMTPAHLGRSIETIRECLGRGEKCLVVSTSLIEAGVDVDFPTVFREMAGLDSIIQAGGRCNREGRRATDKSNVYVFSREAPSERFSAVSAMTARVYELYGDISTPEAIHAYFERLYAVSPSEVNDKLDEKRILALIDQRESDMRGLNYREIAERFRYISKDQKQILIPNGENAEACAAVRSGRLTRGLLRRIGRDSVPVYENEYKKLREAGVLSQECDGAAVLEDPSWYDPDCGLTFRDTGDALLM